MPGITKQPNASATGPAEPSWLIVAWDQLELFRALLQAFGDSRQLRILLDRRRADRRRQVRPAPVDRRRWERRSLPSLEQDLQLRQYILVRPQARRPKDWHLTPDR